MRTHAKLILVHRPFSSTDIETMLPRDEGFWTANTPREARAKLVEALRFELLGPENPSEELRESPLTRYALGMLAPFGTGVLFEESDEELAGDASDDESADAEHGSPVSQALTPSSIGISFLIPDTRQTIVATTTWGDYAAEVMPEVAAEDSATDELTSGQEVAEKKSRKGRPRRIWIRTPQTPTTVVLHLKPNRGLIRAAIGDVEGVGIEHLCRQVGDKLAVSVFLVNRRTTPEGSRPPVDRWIFQPTLRIGSADGAPIFLPRDPEPDISHPDRDHDSNRLLYRNRREFAVGHGCGAEWGGLKAGVATEIRTELLPEFELPRIEARVLNAEGMEMNALASAASPTELRALLMPLLDAYSSWIEDRKARVSDLSKDLRTVANSHIADCSTALLRMQRGIDLLTEDPEAFKAFRFANQAMLLQRSHTLWSRQRKHDPKSAPSTAQLAGRWRPFQLAFILLNLPGLINPISDDRRVGDLLWFPTGGGKTEAYLGLAAFTMALRRRRSIPGMRTDAGTAVLMRYTLRLLTIQQFQRATTLLCACEVLRKADEYTWGHYRFSIGLWLGRDGTPNTHDASRHALTRIQLDRSDTIANPCQLESCPWCGEAITPKDYWTDGEAIRTRVACPRSACQFSKSQSTIGIPALVVDEEIYRECPSMLIATADKFAQMPWNGDIQSLFGFVNRECDRCGFLTAASDHVSQHRSRGKFDKAVTVHESERLAPPDLVIQDELHLISGPLGTLFGLYESAVDFLSSRTDRQHRISPKVISSTATDRRAFEQVQAVFHRSVRVFPPPGLEPEDSFFAQEQPIADSTPGRLYLGVCASGKSMKTAFIRVAASLLSSGAGLRVRPDLADPYETLVSYFNSLRELGGAIRLLDDDIPARLRQLETAGYPRRNRPVYRELTSRIRQEEIPHLLRRLEQRHDAPRTGDNSLPLDAVLASNMISVGVDIDRLGLMTITGQPKATAEYIQASSRVGRQPFGPGLVVVLYNWSRPRDLSHFERFRHYHATLYRHVEATSATPFSSRALDRGIRGTYTAMVRLGADSWSPQNGASFFDPTAARVREVIEALRSRAHDVAGSTVADALTRTLKSLGDEWWGFSRSPLGYGWRSEATPKPNDDFLLRVPEGGRIGHWSAPQSLREVEEQSYVRVSGLDVG